MSSDNLMDVRDQARLELTLQTREKIIRDLLVKGKGTLPEDQGDRDILMKALDGMDRTVLTKAKIKSDDSASKSNAAVASTMAEILKRAHERQLSQRTVDVSIGDATVTDLVEGETSIGVQTFTYAQIMNESE